MSLVEEAEKIGGTPAVFTFQPHPLEVLEGEAPPKLLTQQSKEEAIRHLGVKVLLLVPFTLELASLSPEQFIETVLVRELSVNSVYVGYNYTFGQGSRGTAETLLQGGQRHGFKVCVTPPVTMDGSPVSSTLIRNLLAQGEVAAAGNLLGYYPFVDGVVVEGERRGRTLGFPTANIHLQEGVMVPANGVYAVQVQIDQDDYLGVANIGVKPTFIENNPRANLEVHLLDFQGELYGKRIRVFIHRRIRGEKRFSSPIELVEQINMDINQARSVWPIRINRGSNII